MQDNRVPWMDMPGRKSGVAAGAGRGEGMRGWKKTRLMPVIGHPDLPTQEETAETALHPATGAQRTHNRVLPVPIHTIMARGVNLSSQLRDGTMQNRANLQLRTIITVQYRGHDLLGN